MARLPRSPGAPALALALLPLLLLLPPLPPALAASRVPLPGGPVERPVSDPDVREAAAFAVQAYNRASNSLFYYKALRILGAKSQVVEGMKYYLTMELVNTLYEKKGGSGLNQADLERCEVPPANEQKRQICEFQVWSRPWKHSMQLVHMSCSAESA